jgi:large subunit ribosomal protein L29
MKAHEVRELKKEELIKRIAEEEKNIIDLRFAHQLKQLTNTAKLKIAKNDIARMKTILKEIGSAENASADTNEGVTA